MGSEMCIRDRKNEARELSKKGGTESDVWGEVFSKFYKADKNVNGTR